MAPKTQHIAIMFAGIVGGPRLSSDRSETLVRNQIEACLQQIKAVIARYDGTVIKTMGDEIMCTFPSADAVGMAACAMQEHMQGDASGTRNDIVSGLTLRIGMHYGPAILERGDVFGDAVNVAARMTALAKEDQIITTRETVDLLPKILSANSRCIDRASVKGKREAMDIYELLWQQEDVTRMSTAASRRASPAAAEVKLTHRSKTVSVNENRPQVLLGRSKSADISVQEPLASRQHARIEYRRGKYFIVDQSTNGTYVQLNDEVTFLRRDEMLLSGNGRISLGRSFKEPSEEAVRFALQEP